MAKTCFVIGPIGDEGTDIRTRADNLLQHVVKEVLEAEDMGYEVTRADAIDKTGSITSQIVWSVREADLVVADLADFNPNVIYELALRHVEGKPVVMLKTPGQILPFDFQQNRAIEVDLADLGSVAACKAQLKQQAKHAEENPDEARENPVTSAIQFRAVQETDRGEVLGAILSRLEQIEARLPAIRPGLAALGRLVGPQSLGPDFAPLSTGKGAPLLMCGRCRRLITTGGGDV